MPSRTPEITSRNPAFSMLSRTSISDPASAVVGERAKALGHGRLVQLPARGAVRDQLVELGVHLQDLDDRHAAPVALVVALVAAYGPVQRGRSIGLHREDSAFARARL